VDDISKKIREEVIKKLTPSEKFDLNEKESRELLRLNPFYGINYLIRKFKNRPKS